MKKFILGLIVGAVLFVPATALADYVVSTPQANNIYKAGINGGIEIDVFDDNNYKCYVAYRDRGANYADDEPSISCIKR